MSGEPSRVNATKDIYMGKAKEGLGNLMGAEDLSKSGVAQKLEGEAEYEAVQNQQYAEGKGQEWKGKAEEFTGISENRNDWTESNAPLTGNDSSGLGSTGLGSSGLTDSSNIGTASDEGRFDQTIGESKQKMSEF
ncbi:hypothetical protein MIR68_009397 [Amoeboaphelidium protococcarum]|nr:hypothetical protein MIR68_009397 [Amoeboaphelidium protococcarum]